MATLPEPPAGLPPAVPGSVSDGGADGPGGPGDGPANRRPRGRRLRWLALGLVAVLGLALVVGGPGVAAWLWRTQAGAEWVLARVPGLQVDGWQGAIGSGRFSARRLQLDLGAGRLVIDGLSAQGVAWHWRPHAGAWVGLGVQQLDASAVTWHSAPSTGPSAPLTEPGDFGLPAVVDVAALQVGAVQVDALPPLSDLRAAVHLGADGGRAHEIDGLRFGLDKLQARVQVRIATAAPHRLAVQADLQSVPPTAAAASVPPAAAAASAPLAAGALPVAPADRWAWTAHVDLQGPLAGPALQAHLQGTPLPGRAAPTLDLQAGLRPFAHWPLGALNLSAAELDLAALSSAAPHTRLQGRVQATLAGLNAPARATVALQNLAPGRWDQGSAPVRQLDMVVAGQPDQHDRLRVQLFDLHLGTAQAEGGHLRGQGQWDGTSAALKLQLDRLHPAALDARLAAMTLSGPVQIDLSHLPLPAALRSASAASPGAPGEPLPQAHGVAQLKGQLDAKGSPAAALMLDVSADPRHLNLRQVRLQAGGATASLQGQVDLLGAAPAQSVHWKAQAQLTDFDPQVWWPGAAAGAWPRGPHRLTAQLDSDASAPLATLRDPLRGWRAFNGRLQATLSPSLLAGVDLQGGVKLDSNTDAKSPGLQVQGQLEAAGNRLTVDGRADPSAAAQDQLKLTIAAPALKALAPLFTLDPRLQAWTPHAGTVQADARLEGRGDARTLRASADVEGLDAGSVKLQQAHLQAEAGATLDARLALALKLQDLHVGALQIDHLATDLSGSARAHQLDFSADSPLKPPLALEQYLAVDTGNGTRLQLKLAGVWQPGQGTAASGLQGGRWQGQVTELRAGGRQGAGLPSDGRQVAAPWLAAKQLRATVDFDAAGVLHSAGAEPGAIELAGTRLQWSQARWLGAASPGAPPQIDLEASVQDFALAPLLARAQPDLAWRGDLLLGGRLSVHSQSGMSADAVFERRSGDLSVGDVGGTREPLGLNSVRLALSAHEGVWHLTQTLAGKQLGELAGAVTLRTSADRLLPPADAPIEGALNMHVAQLGVWGTWVPPGWRIGGELNTTVTVGGRFNAPEFTGRLTGHGLSVRNVLQGVQVSDGEVAVSLEGTKAVVEQFEFKGGDGRLVLKGGATLGADPRLQLQLDADHFQWLGRIDRRVVASGQATLDMTRDALRLDGKLKVDEGLFDVSASDAPSLDSDVNVEASAASSAASAAAASATTAPPSADGAAAARAPRVNTLALQIDLGDKLRVKGRGLDAYLRGQLKLGSVANKLTLQGTVRAERGTYAAYGQKLEIERGQIIFNGSLDDPRLDILAIRPNLDVKVGVAVTGSALNPRIQLFSDPDMSDLDKLSWLVLGRASDGLGRADTALLQRAALALLAGDGAGPGDGILNSLGLTDFSLSQTTGVNDTRETVVSLGKQLSRRWYVGYERSVTAATGTWQVVYRIAQRFTLRAQSGSDNSLDLIWTWRWN
jgi:translocation and assembly module TamB